MYSPSHTHQRLQPRCKVSRQCNVGALSKSMLILLYQVCFITFKIQTFNSGKAAYFSFQGKQIFHTTYDVKKSLRLEV